MNVPGTMTVKDAGNYVLAATRVDKEEWRRFIAAEADRLRLTPEDFRRYREERGEA